MLLPVSRSAKGECAVTIKEYLEFMLDTTDVSEREKYRNLNFAEQEGMRTALSYFQHVPGHTPQLVRVWMSGIDFQYPVLPNTHVLEGTALQRFDVEGSRWTLLHLHPSHWFSPFDMARKDNVGYVIPKAQKRKDAYVALRTFSCLESRIKSRFVNWGTGSQMYRYGRYTQYFVKHPDHCLTPATYV